MSARIETPPAREAATRAGALAARAVVPAGVAFLAARPFLAATPQARTLLFAAGLVIVGTAALASPGVEAQGGVHPLPPVAVLALGIVAVAAAAAAAGSPPPAPWGAATLPLALVAAVAEEALFRRAAYGRLLQYGAPVAIVASALLFALVHLPAYGAAAFPVDLGAGLLLSWQRWASGTWAVSAATHAFANLLAVAR